MTRRSVAVPTPVLTVTARIDHGEVGVAIEQAEAALREAAQRFGLAVAGGPVRVDHGDASIVEVCLPVDRLPETEPPPPLAAEVLTPGTTVESLGAT